MKNFEFVKALVGESVSEKDLEHIDCFYNENLGIFVPISGKCGYAKNVHTHQSYMIVVAFDRRNSLANCFPAAIFSPEIPHIDDPTLHYYVIFIPRKFFEERYKMYAQSVPVFAPRKFEVCPDILKYMNMFAFEASKNMQNSDIMLNAHAELITHWIIRSILGENMDTRSVSNDYSVARAQNYMEHHFGERITIKRLSELGFVSPSGLTHKFKAEMGVSPIEYLIEIRIRHSKIMLQRKNMTVTEIAHACGFSNSAYFSSCFQKRTGVTPTEYQRRYDAAQK